MHRVPQLGELAARALEPPLELGRTQVRGDEGAQRAAGTRERATAAQCEPRQQSKLHGVCPEHNECVGERGCGPLLGDGGRRARESGSGFPRIGCHAGEGRRRKRDVGLE